MCYGGRKIESFTDLLKEYHINLLVDVRRFPKSKNQGFDREGLKEELSKYGITCFMGEELGVLGS
ncbi:MAG: DUF488 domain-containing protein [archaeon]|nr:DUF488 domain-containing protein [archaeon]MCP8305514.1 DUF488 domain-containing protein [archaeon]